MKGETESDGAEFGQQAAKRSDPAQRRRRLNPKKRRRISQHLRHHPANTIPQTPLFTAPKPSLFCPPSQLPSPPQTPPAQSSIDPDRSPEPIAAPRPAHLTPPDYASSRYFDLDLDIDIEHVEDDAKSSALANNTFSAMANAATAGGNTTTTTTVITTGSGTTTTPILPPRARALTRSSFSAFITKLRTTAYSDLPGGRAAPSLASVSHNLRTIAWSPLGNLVATGAGDRTLRIWNPERAHVKNSTELRGHVGAVERVAWHPVREAELASCSADGTVRFWDVRSGSRGRVGEIKLSGEGLTCVWKPDGGEVVVGTKVCRFCSSGLELLRLECMLISPGFAGKRPLDH